MRLNKQFYLQSTEQVAQQLLGKFLIRRIGQHKIEAQIVETEAYIGPQDKASHASKGKTPRTQIMFGPPGQAYIYLIYGMYYCFNIVTEKQDYPAAVLIRAVQPVKKEKPELINGPGKLCRYLKINKTLNNKNLITSKKIWLEDRNINIKSSQIVKTQRIGIDYSGPYWSKRKLRFYIKNNQYISKK